MSSYSITAQDYFFEFVEGWRNNGCYEFNNEYIFMGLQIAGGLSEHELIFNHLDFTGDLVNQQSFFVDSTLSTSSRNSAYMYEFINDSILIGAGVVRIEATNQLKGALYKHNILSNQTTLLQTYSQDVETKFFLLKYANDSTLFVSGHLEDGNFGDMSLYNLNLQGEIRWFQSWGCGGLCTMTPKQVITHSNESSVYVLGEEYDNSFQTFYERLSTVLIKTDSMGQEEWRVYPGDEENFWIQSGGILELDDGILLSYTDVKYYDSDGEWHFNDENTIHLEKYSLDGELLWEHNFYESIPNNENSPYQYLYEIFQIQELQDGNVLISGTDGFDGLLLKISDDGDVIWKRSHAIYDENNNPTIAQFTHFYNVTPTSDGGFMVAGQYDSTPSDVFPGGIQTAIALKVDEYGCLEPGCQLVDAIDEKFR